MLERLFITRYLLNRSRSSVVRIIALLSVGGVAVGVMAMVVVLSVMNGFDDAIRNRLLNVESHLRVRDIKPTPEFEDKIKKAVGSRGDVETFSTQDVILRTLDGVYSGAVARGVPQDFIESLEKQNQKIQIFRDELTGDSNRSEGLELGPREVALGVELAHQLGIFTGDEVNLIAPESLLLPAGEMPVYERVKVKALLRTDVPHFDSQTVIFSRQVGLPRLVQAASLEQGYEIRLKNMNNLDDVERDVKNVLGGAGKIESWEKLNPGLFYSLRMEKISMGMFLGLTVLVSCFSIVTVLVLLVTEKRVDVGILRSLGATKKQIRKIFVFLGVTLGLTGIMGGLVLGLLICFTLDRFPIIQLPNIYYDTSIPVSMDWVIIGGIIVLGSVLTVLGTLVPAWNVAELSPVNAIRRVDE